MLNLMLTILKVVIISINLISCSEESAFREGGKKTSGSATSQEETPAGPVNPEAESQNPQDQTNPKVATGSNDVKDVPENAVKVGSFTVFTTPEDPLPMQPYEIIIQVSISGLVENYAIEDLNVKVLGTDGYQLYLIDGKAYHFDPALVQDPENSAGQDPADDLISAETILSFIFDGQIAELGLTIPGGFAEVRDEITVQSKLLDETQVVQLVF